MQPKSSAHYQREYRKRLREQGLVKKEVWILPENARQLAAYEQRLRVSAVQQLIESNKQTSHVGVAEKSTVKVGLIQKGEDQMSDTQAPWTTTALHQALQVAPLVTGGHASVELMDGVSPALHIVMNEFGDLPVFLTVAGEQILVESLLWSVRDVKNADKFNEAILRTHKYFPLSTISLDKIDGEDCYHMFGALSSQSSLQNIVFEVEILAANVIQATQAYAEFLVESVDF